jgi:hypothetical protein
MSDLELPPLAEMLETVRRVDGLDLSDQSEPYVEGYYQHGFHVSGRLRGDADPQGDLATRPEATALGAQPWDDALLASGASVRLAISWFHKFSFGSPEDQGKAYVDLLAAAEKYDLPSIEVEAFRRTWAKAAATYDAEGHASRALKSRSRSAWVPKPRKRGKP